MTTWDKLIAAAMSEAGETWDDVEATTLTLQQLAAEFDDGYGIAEGCPFTIWTKSRVYFPAVYDGAEWVACVSRNPDGNPTNHIGGQ